MTWLLVSIALIFQELASTGAALLDAQANNLNPWIIHVIWFSATIIDITVGLFLGRWVQREFKNSKLDEFAKKWATRAERIVGRTGTKVSIVLLGFITYPYLIAFVASWLPNITVQDVFLYTILGNLFWYMFVWATVLGITAAGHNYELIFTIIAVAGITLVAITNFIKNKIGISHR